MKLVKLNSNERHYFGDTLFAAVDSFRHAQGDTARLLSADAGPTILAGFVPAYSNGIVSVTPGRALLTYNDGDEMQPGLLVTEEARPATFSCVNLPNGTYTIFVTFSPVLTNLESRTRYQGGSQGFDQSFDVYTRQDAGYSVVVAAASPGDEYLPLGTLVLPTGTVTDARSFLFEGSADDQFANGWGSDADRADDRSQAPLPDLRTTIAALKTAIEDVKGARWWVKTGAAQTGGSGPAAPALGTYKGHGPPDESQAVAGRAYYDLDNDTYYIAS